MKTMEYLWEGRMMTVAEIHKLVPAYHKKWLYYALSDGCTCRADLVERERQKKANLVHAQKTSGRNNAKVCGKTQKAIRKTHENPVKIL